jgi:signal transduction histidine kinase
MYPMESTPSTSEMLGEALEMKVQARTRELTELNRQLEEMLDQRQRLEAQLIQSEKMASLGQLAAGIAHEINNPIGFIMSNLDTLSDYLAVLNRMLALYQDYERAVDSPARKIAEAQAQRIREAKEQEDFDFMMSDMTAILDQSREGMVRIKEIVRNLKSFSHVDEDELKEANVNDCIENALKIAWNELKYKCRVHKDYGELPRIACYPGQLNQVFMNLLVNAAQAIPEQGDISITTRYVKPHGLNNETSKAAIEISLADTGIGIPEAEHARIFDPFFTTKPVGSGTGLGLAIVYGIIQKHGGHIRVESEVGRGTTFHITLPLERSQYQGVRP